MKAGVDTLMAPVNNPLLLAGIHLAEDRTGQGIILVDTPGINVDDNAQARRDAEKVIEQSKRNGATFCLIHHGSAEQLVNKNKRTIERLPDYLSMIRSQGMIPGLSAHMPELIIYSDMNEYDVQTYVQLYKLHGIFDASRSRIYPQGYLERKKASYDDQIDGSRPCNTIRRVEFCLEYDPAVRYGNRWLHDAA